MLKSIVLLNSSKQYFIFYQHFNVLKCYSRYININRGFIEKIKRKSLKEMAITKWKFNCLIKEYIQSKKPEGNQKSLLDYTKLKILSIKLNVKVKS